MKFLRAAAYLLLGSALAWPAWAQNRAAPPDLEGVWSRMTFGFERPAAGPGPIGRYNNQSNVGGNFNNPILTPAGAAIVKKRSEILRSGEDYPNPSLNCL